MDCTEFESDIAAVATYKLLTLNFDRTGQREWKIFDKDYRGHTMIENRLMVGTVAGEARREVLSFAV